MDCVSGILFSPPLPPNIPPLPPAAVTLGTQPLCHATCVEWALSDGGGSLASTTSQTTSCASFYANLCAFDSQRFVALVGGSVPPSPPPELFEDAEIRLNKSSAFNPVVVRVLASGGFDQSEMNSNVDPVEACTDYIKSSPRNTACVPNEKERPVFFHILTFKVTHIH